MKLVLFASTFLLVSCVVPPSLADEDSSTNEGLYTLFIHVAYLAVTVC